MSAHTGSTLCSYWASSMMYHKPHIHKVESTQWHYKLHILHPWLSWIPLSLQILYCYLWILRHSMTQNAWNGVINSNPAALPCPSLLWKHVAAVVLVLQSTFSASEFGMGFIQGLCNFSKLHPLHTQFRLAGCLPIDRQPDASVVILYHEFIWWKL